MSRNVDRWEFFLHKLLHKRCNHYTWKPSAGCLYIFNRFWLFKYFHEAPFGERIQEFHNCSLASPSLSPSPCERRSRSKFKSLPTSTRNKTPYSRVFHISTVITKRVFPRDKSRRSRPAVVISVNRFNYIIRCYIRLRAPQLGAEGWSKADLTLILVISQSRR